MNEENILIQWTDKAIKITVECDCEDSKLFYSFYISLFSLL